MFQDAEPVWETVLGYKREELMAGPLPRFIHPDDQPATSNEAQNNSQGRNAISFANRYRCKDRFITRWLLWNATPVIERGLIYAVARDITEQKRVEDSMRKLNENLQEQTAQLEILNKELEAFSYAFRMICASRCGMHRRLRGFCCWARRTRGRIQRQHRYLKFISRIRAAHDGPAWWSDLLAFSRMGTGGNELRPEVDKHHGTGARASGANWSEFVPGRVPYVEGGGIAKGPGGCGDAAPGVCQPAVQCDQMHWAGSRIWRKSRWTTPPARTNALWLFVEAMAWGLT